MSETGIGASVKRKEDARFIVGKGTFTDDINLPNQVYAFMVRSPHAHAKIKRIDKAAAEKAPGVVAVFTGEDMVADKVGGLPCGWQIHSRDGSPMVEPPHLPLTPDVARFVGDEVAVVRGFGAGGTLWVPLFPPLRLDAGEGRPCDASRFGSSALGVTSPRPISATPLLPSCQDSRGVLRGNFPSLRARRGARSAAACVTVRVA